MSIGTEHTTHADTAGKNVFSQIPQYQNTLFAVFGKQHGLAKAPAARGNVVHLHHLEVLTFNN
jgi:hypothetical protein